MKLRTYDAPQSLDSIFDEDDDLDLLAGVEAAKPKAASREDVGITNFKEIVAFYETHDREPDMTTERQLAVRLRSYRTRPKLTAQALPYDTVGLLADKSTTKPREVQSLADIFDDDDDLDLLDSIDTSIFQLGHISPVKEKDLPDEIASRKPCEDFYCYEKLFHDAQKAVEKKSVLLEKFSRKSDASVGQIFILRGVLCYVDCVLDSETSDKRLENPRLRVIFANGTETDLLKLSLARALYKDPHSKRVDYNPNLFSDDGAALSPQSDPTGFIYVLATESKAPALAQLKAQGKLVKIGYSTQPVQERIKNAETDRTYLEAPVRLLAEIACFNLNPQKFENLVHAFLCEQRVHMTLRAHDGTNYHPEEWFAVDVATAVAVCEKVVDGSIVDYRMDNVSGRMMLKSGE
ncbi:MAG: GIY-YIG nuclease family protein [Pseudomonadota bacterium]